MSDLEWRHKPPMYTLPPQCPSCPQATMVKHLYVEVTAAYCPPVYDEQGEDISPSHFIRTHHHECMKCGTQFTVQSGRN